MIQGPIVKHSNERAIIELGCNECFHKDFELVFTPAFRDSGEGM